MPEKAIYVNGVGTVRFPDSMSDEQIASTIREKIIPQRNAEQRKGSSTFGEQFSRQFGRTPVGQALSGPGEALKDVGTQQYTDPLAGLLNLGNAALRTGALPFSLLDATLRQGGLGRVADVGAAPFQAVGKATELAGRGIDELLPQSVKDIGSPQARSAMNELTQGAAQMAAMGGAARAIPRTAKPAPLMSGVKEIVADRPNIGNVSTEGTLPPAEIIPPAFRAEMVKKLGGPTVMTKFGEVGKLSDADLAKVYGEKGLDVPAPISEAPVSRGGDMSVRGPANEAQIAQLNPVQKVIDAIGQAKPIREQQERAYHLERVRRAGKLAGVYEKASGEASLPQALSTQKGELPKTQFEPIRDKLTQGDLDSMHDQVIKSKLSVYEKLGAQIALDKLFTKEGTGVPTKGELSLLEDVFGKGLTDAILSKRSLWQKVKDEFIDALNVPRTLMSAFDMSMPFRQVVVQTVSHPLKSSGAFKEMHRSFFSEKAFQEVKKDLQERPNAPLYKEFRLDILDADKQTGPLTAREESFTSHLAERIPFIGKGVRMSERAAYTYTNKVRADVFDMYAEQLQKAGITPEKSPEHYTQLARWVNITTGRGNFGSFNRYAPTASALMFSPRLLASRFQMLDPLAYAKMPKEVRVMAMKDMMKFVGAGTALLTLAKAGGASVEMDPRSSDFGKIRVGNTRIDPWGGFVQIARLFAQVGSGQRKTVQGEVKDMDNSTPYAGNRFETIQRFGESKLNPHIGFIVSWLKGKNFIGEPFEVRNEAAQRLAPLYLQDAYDAAMEEGLMKGVGMTVPAFYGTGVSTYKPKPGKANIPTTVKPPTVQSLLRP